MTKAKVIICSEENIKTALAAGAKAGVDRKNIFILGNNEVEGVRPFTDLLSGSRKAIPIELTYEEAKETVAYLCFSSGTTGKSKGVMTT
jgi:acyl-coenzyme A synthetase/AMP-(fatty) acid ligase